MPEPYPAKITPRSKERAEIVKREWEEAKNSLLDPISKQWNHVPDGMALPSL
jgi:hypothetical protein